MDWTGSSSIGPRMRGAFGTLPARLALPCLARARAGRSMGQPGQDQTRRQSAAWVEGPATAAESLMDQATLPTALVAQFHPEDNAAPQGPAHTTKPADAPCEQARTRPFA